MSTEKAESTAALARETNHLPTRAEALYQLGLLQMKHGDGKPAEVMKFGSAWANAHFELIDQTTEIAPGITLIALVSDAPGTRELKELSLAVNTPDGGTLLKQSRVTISGQFETKDAVLAQDRYESQPGTFTQSTYLPGYDPATLTIQSPSLSNAALGGGTCTKTGTCTLQVGSGPNYSPTVGNFVNQLFNTTYQPSQFFLTKPDRDLSLMDDRAIDRLVDAEDRHLGVIDDWRRGEAAHRAEARHGERGSREVVSRDRLIASGFGDPTHFAGRLP